ncbi:hypothetical protein [Bifidobacterium longum]|nr:hypothetical protein [Bifidobacterium longum]
MKWPGFDVTWFLFRLFPPRLIGDDGIMAKGVRYTEEFRELPLQALEQF